MRPITNSTRASHPNAYLGAKGPSYGRNSAFAQFLRTLTGVNDIR